MELNTAHAIVKQKVSVLIVTVCDRLSVQRQWKNSFIFIPVNGRKTSSIFFVGLFLKCNFLSLSL